jgi:nitrogen fixation protein FixH
MRQSSWGYFPLAVVGGLGLVVAVNAGLIFAAIQTFPGKAGDEGFALSNHYDAVLEREQREAALGWSLAAQTDEAGRPVITLTDRAGRPLRGASVSAAAERPLGAADTQRLAFRESGSGHYVADASLPASGQWELTVSASADGHDLAATRRVIVH